MNISKGLLICIFSTVLCFNTIRAAKPAAMPPMGNDNAMQPMNNEEQMLAQQLDSVFEELTKGMSETEKNQFFNELNTAMEEEIDKMSKMNDNELTKYIEDAEKELQNLGPWPEPEPQVQPAAPVVHTEPAKPAEPVKEEPKKPSRDMVPAIDEIAARIDSFTQKANQVVEMSAYVRKMGQKRQAARLEPNNVLGCI